MNHMNWIYNGSNIISLADLPEGTIGFIYKISNKTTGEYYIGKKSVKSTRKRKFGKKEIALLTDKRLKPYEMVTKESDWKEYRSSNKQVQEWFKDVTNNQLELKILRFCSNVKSLTYYELQEQFAHDVLGDTNALNENLLGKFFRRDILGDI